ncbi:zinc ribbon domain-containing protein [Oceanobacillus polygoni]|uniref:Membrane protein YvbJ n=1 Tax=Oceanobacillus polygoni TaxID=1235259 RepID=A0A9X0YQP6_9BACI|nr:hypothetical protein [Oceanobacillus polygoni]MBP2077042.1 putative membrane protein YvbJ [Oceanobacillus polygoni]
MNKFCKECGGSIASSLKFCQHCGHKLETPSKTDPKKQVNPPVESKQSRKLTKKQKMIVSVAAGLFVIFAGFYMWGKSYMSAENTVERFVEALKEENQKVIQNIAVLNYDSELSDAEIEALISLAKADNEYINLAAISSERFLAENELFTLVQNGKWLGIFDRLSISVKSQYIEVYNPFEGVVNTFNDSEISIHEDEDYRIVYGPMSPGIYNLSSKFSGEYTEVEANDTVILADEYSDWVMHDVELEADYVMLDLYNTNGVPVEKAYIELNDQQINFNDSLVINELGPLDLDGSITVTPVIETKWGKVKLDKLKLEDTYYELYVDKISEGLIESLSEEISVYGEEYVKAHAGHDANLFSNITDEMKDTFVSNFEYDKDMENYFTGQLDKIEVDFNNLQFYEEESTVAVPTAFYFTSAFHYSDEEANLAERINYCNLEIVYNEDDQWLIDDCYANSFWSSDFDDSNSLVKLEGSKELHKADKSTVVSTSEVISDDQIEEVTLNYIYNLVEAINTNDYNYVKPFIKDGSELYDMQLGLVDRLNENGVTQEVINAVVTNIEEKEDKWMVTTEEKIKVIYESGKEETNDYVWKYIVEKDGNEVVLVNIDE